MTNKITKVYRNGVEYDIYASGGAAGTGDVTGPSSSTDADIALFNGATGKIIKDSGKKLSDYQTALSTQTAYTTKGTATKVATITTNTLGQVTAISETNITFPVTSVNGSTGAVTGLAEDNAVVKLTGNQTIAGTKTFSTSPVVPSKTTAAANTGTAIATEAQVYKKQNTISDLSTIRTNATNGATVVSGNSGTTYTIKKSTTAPTSASNTTITFVVE